MKRISVLKAEGYTGEEVESMVIVAETTIKYDQGRSLDELDKVFNDDAEKLEETLHKTLPGGTYDRLIGMMLTRKASHFIVPIEPTSRQTDIGVLVAQQDDVAPDAAVEFEERFKAIMHTTVGQFKAFASITRNDLRTEWARGHWTLVFDGDDPCYKLFKK